MLMFSTLSSESRERLMRLNTLEYVRPQFKLGEVANMLLTEANAKDVQNWTLRGFLTPAHNAPRRNKLYSLRNVLQASVLGLLGSTNTLDLAHSVAVEVAEHTESLIAQRFDFVAAWEVGELPVYYFAITPDGGQRGKFLTRERLSQIISKGESVRGVQGFDRRMFEAGEVIMAVLAKYAAHDIHERRRFSCDHTGWPTDPLHPWSKQDGDDG